MSEKQKFPIETARRVAEELKESFANSCSKICIAGSIRRGKPMVSDIELVYIPKWDRWPDPTDLFDVEKMDVNLADMVIQYLEKESVLARRPNKLGSETYGPKNKLMVHVASGIPVDLFATTSENWWVSLVVRTGSKETNLRLTTGAQRLGRTLNAYGSGVTLLRDQTVFGRNALKGDTIRAESERDVFSLCGCGPYLEPENR